MYKKEIYFVNIVNITLLVIAFTAYMNRALLYLKRRSM